MLMHACRYPSSQAKEGAAGCQTKKQAQQAGAGGQEYLPSKERPGAPGNTSADRDETRQVSREVSTNPAICVSGLFVNVDSVDLKVCGPLFSGLMASLT